MSSCRTACIQVNFGADLTENLQQIDALIRQAAAQGAQLIVTPECSDTMIWPTRTKLENAYSAADHPALKAYQALAKELRVHIVVGSLAVRAESQERLWNRSFLINDAGRILTSYDKIHLFDAALSEEETYRESKYYNAGSMVRCVQTDLAKIGMSICYDVRFSQLFRTLGQDGAQIITVPAAFAVLTGQAHWEVMLRARAIETGCYIVAPGQTGDHSGDRSTYGHSMIVDPWGKIVAQMGTETGILIADLDLDYVAQCRRALPSLSHDRGFMTGL